MAVPATTGATSGATTPASAKATAKTVTDYQSFLKLLVAQMKNQDPTDPADPTQYVAQLATFSQVEQSVQINTKLDQILQASALAQADGIIGHAVMSEDGQVMGIAESVKLGASGLIAVLKDGTELPITTGVTIGPKP